MKNNYIGIRLSQRRVDKLRLYAAQMDKSMTAILEECIDRLPSPEIGNNSTISRPNQPDG